MTTYEQYESVIGLEIHIQLATLSKAFCGDATRFGEKPNTQVSEISLGHPGTLPKLNVAQVEYAIKLGLALGCTISPVCYFDRKNYFYADLPKGYQITQDNQPICQGGSIDIRVGEMTKKIRIHHIHMEEDAGKSIHDEDPANSLIDLNRAGVPLLEIVTEPDLRSGEEVDALMNAMRQLVRYLEISDGNMEQGSMRCDCNISVRKKGEQVLNNRCEVKNVNSMRFARRAIAYEFHRQVDLMEAGQTIAQQTLNFDPVSGTTSPLRDKEDAHDYRYFPEPDLPPVELSEENINSVAETMPPLPWQLYDSFREHFSLSDYDARLLTEEKDIAFFFYDLAFSSRLGKASANLIINKIRPYIQEQNMEMKDFPVSILHLTSFLQLIDAEEVSHAIAYQRLLPALIEHPALAPIELAQKLNLIQSNDEGFLEKLVQEAIAKYPEKVKAYRKGKKGLIGFFMGEVMKNSQGKAEPKASNALLRKYLEA